jgi:hypothetical protein
MWCLDYVWCVCFFPSGFMTMICMGGVETRTKGLGHAGSSNPSQRSTRIFHCNSLGINTAQKKPQQTDPVQGYVSYTKGRGLHFFWIEESNFQLVYKTIWWWDMLGPSHLFLLQFRNLFQIHKIELGGVPSRAHHSLAPKHIRTARRGLGGRKKYRFD